MAKQAIVARKMATQKNAHLAQKKPGVYVRGHTVSRVLRGKFVPIESKSDDKGDKDGRQ